MHAMISPPQPAAPKFSCGRLLAVVGSFCLFAPLVGISITVVSMMRGFAGMPQSALTTEADTLGNSIGDALVATAIGFGVSSVGICLVCISIFAFRFTPLWLKNVLIASSLLWLVVFPVGTAIAIVAIVILIRNGRAFAAPANG